MADGTTDTERLTEAEVQDIRDTGRRLTRAFEDADAQRAAWVEKARPFMAATCHLLQCRYPGCIGKSNICNMRGESLVGFMVEHDRLIAERDAEIARLRAAVQSSRREALTGVVEWHEAKRAWNLSAAGASSLAGDHGCVEMCEFLANEHADAAAYFRSLIPQEPQGEQT